MTTFTLQVTLDVPDGVTVFNTQQAFIDWLSKKYPGLHDARITTDLVDHNDAPVKTRKKIARPQ